MTKTAEDKWWDEDAKRHNAIGAAMVKAGIGVGTSVKPPELEADGSLPKKPKKSMAAVAFDEMTERLEKHLPGSHNQMSHGRGGGGGAVDAATAKAEAKKKIMAMTEGKSEKELLSPISKAEKQQSKFFKTDAPGAMQVEISQLSNIRARPKGIHNAMRIMYASAIGKNPMGKRDPVSVQKQTDGKFRIHDGNSTFAVAKLAGWKKITARLVDDKGVPLSKSAKHNRPGDHPMGGRGGGGAKPFHEMDSKELTVAMQKFAKDTTSKKAAETAKRKQLNSAFKSAQVAEKAATKSVGTTEEVSEARSKWEALHRSAEYPLLDSATSAAYDKFSALNKTVETPEYLAARKKVRELGSDIVKFNEGTRKNNAKKEAVDMLRLPKEKRAVLKVSVERALTRKAILKHTEEFSTLVSNDAIEVKFVNFRKTEESRAFYNGRNGVSLSKPGSSKKTVIHEMGHWLDDKNLAVGAASRKFLDARVQGAKKERLGGRHRKDEVYRKRTDGGKWIDNYMGKDYGRGKYDSTEITSMGLEMYATDPMKLVTKDPGLFTHIASIARGEVR